MPFTLFNLTFTSIVYILQKTGTPLNENHQYIDINGHFQMVKNAA